MSWNKTVVDRSTELNRWVDYCYQIRQRGVLVYAYANNHYAGHAPATVQLFRKLWRDKGLPELDEPRPSPKKLPLFG
jgi:uncharacterized protein YecE (DUF72 family)